PRAGWIANGSPQMREDGERDFKEREQHWVIGDVLRRVDDMVQQLVVAGAEGYLSILVADPRDPFAAPKPLHPRALDRAVVVSLGPPRLRLNNGTELDIDIEIEPPGEEPIEPVDELKQAIIAELATGRKPAKDVDW